MPSGTGHLLYEFVYYILCEMKIIIIKHIKKQPPDNSRSCLCYRYSSKNLSEFKSGFLFEKIYHSIEKQCRQLYFSITNLTGKIFQCSNKVTIVCRIVT